MRDFDLEVYFAQWEFAVKHHLTASDAETLKLSELLALADAEGRERWEQLALSYTETSGNPWLRGRIAATYDTRSADDVLVCVGAQEGIFCAVHALLDRDDHAIVVVPNYQSIETIALSRCAVSGVPLDPQRQWTLDIDRVRAELRPNTKLIAINFPNNPTGKVLERDRFDALVDLCRSRGIWLLSDEVHRLLERDATKRLPQAADVYERGLSLGVMSKAYGLPGLRLGWIVCRDAAIRGRMERMKHYLSICSPGPSEVLAGIALGARAQIVARNLAITVQNLALLNAFFADYPDLFEWWEPEGSAVAFPRYRGADGVERFTTRLVENAGVLLTAASLYRSELLEAPRDRFRIGYGRASLPPGLMAMRAFLEHDDARA